MKNKLVILTGILATGLLVACGVVTSKATPIAPRVFPTATYHFLFQGNAPVDTSNYPVSMSGAPTVAGIFLPQPTATPSPVVTAAATTTLAPRFTAVPTRQPEFFRVSVYEDRLNPNWVVQRDTGMGFELNSSSQAFHGRSAISFIPRVKSKSEYGSLLFTVSDQSTEAYPRDQVTSLSFWLYSGNEPLQLDQMAVTILGSNSQPYWSAHDDSVAASGQNPTFSETRLYFLGFNHDIPARTWVPVEVNLDKLIYDPDYKYVTGFYLKMEKGFARTLWIDDVQLVMLGRPSEISTLEPTPTGNSE